MVTESCMLRKCGGSDALSTVVSGYLFLSTRLYRVPATADGDDQPLSMGVVKHWETILTSVVMVPNVNIV